MENQSPDKILPKCSHLPYGIECGEFLQVGSVLCPKCKGITCPKCSASASKEQKLCLKCGLELCSLRPLQTDEENMSVSEGSCDEQNAEDSSEDSLSDPEGHDTNQNAETNDGANVGKTSKQCYGVSTSQQQRSKKQARKERRRLRKRAEMQTLGEDKNGKDETNQTSDGVGKHEMELNNKSQEKFVEDNTRERDSQKKESENNSEKQEYQDCCFHAILAPTILCDHKEDTVYIKVEGISPDKAKQKLKCKR
ncbi:unnamed protein product [Mytilus coruscus]|uniref:Uncharacterized protein n=1 Tax=Mytilus coruscus TaxID=42192 RepID=A0A6J8ACE8_MYTCO|nr:unnamed protein product [Mytilus coruscus]